MLFGHLRPRMRTERALILDVVERTAACVFMPVTVGGGVRTIEDIRALLNAGADKVSINTAAVQRPEFVQSRTAIRDAVYRRRDRCQKLSRQIGGKSLHMAVENQPG